MRLRCWIGVVAALAVTAVPARAQVNLEWKLNVNDRFFLQTESTFSQVMELPGKDVGKEVKQDIVQTSVLQFFVEKKTPEGNYVIKETIEGLMVKGAAGAVVPDNAIQGATFTITLSPKWEIVKVEGYNELVKKLADSEDDKVLKTVKSILSEELLTKSAKEAFGFLPAKQVKEGDTWGRDRTVKMPLGPLGTLETTHLYKYEGKGKLNDKEYDKVTFTTTVDYSIPKEDAGLGFKVTKGDLKAENAKGTIYFDSAAGRLVQYETTLNLTGNLTLSVNNVPLETKITKQEQKIKVILTTENPVTKPK